MSQIRPFNICIVGESGCGKSSILRSLKNESFICQMQQTIGIDFFRTQSQLEDKIYTFHILDNSGCAKFQAVVERQINQADLVIICTDLTKEDAISDVNNWLSNIESRYQIVPVVIVGNKSDLEPHKNSSKLLHYFRNFSIFQTSAKNGYNIKEMFLRAFQIVVNQNKRLESQYHYDGYRVNKKEINSKDKEKSCFLCW